MALQCQQCFRSFARSGHLRRHERIHTANRPFRCQICHRAFPRRDALQRHQSSHTAAPSLLQVGGRACINCASAKTRCTGEGQCKRCRDRGLPCTYPTVAPPLPPAADPPNAPGAPQFHQTAANGSTLGTSLQDSSVSGTDSVDFDAWDPDFLCETNWLEEPNAADFLWSPPDVSSLSSRYGVNHTTVSNHEQLEPFLDIPRTHDAAAVDPSSAGQTPQNDGEAQDGEFYVDGESARLPRVRRRKGAPSGRPNVKPPSFTVFSLEQPRKAIVADRESVSMNLENYQSIQTLYQRLCLTSCDPSSTFADVELPPKHVFEELIGLGLDNFDQIMPFLHKPTLSGQPRHYVLDLAIAAIGSHYLSNSLFSASLHEFTRRCLRTLQDYPDLCIEQDTSYVAASLLNTIGLAFCGDDRLLKQAQQNRHQLLSAFMVLHHNVDSHSAVLSTNCSGETGDWRNWIQHESTIRLAYSIWLLDTMLAYSLGSGPHLNLRDVSIPLPCEESLWRAENEEQWRASYNADARRPNLPETLQELYIHKNFSATHSEFTRILTIHGLFHRLWEVERYYSDPLAHWEPTSARQRATVQLPKSPVWLPSLPAFRKWRNVSCDALDVLHWQANAAIGKARGLEHPTVLHLHVARIVLLTPYNKILELARCKTSALANNVQQSINSTTKIIQRWAAQNQYKARLAVIHAGVVSWHVRRYSIDAFYEAPAVGLAMIVLWAFSTFANRSIRSANQTPSSAMIDPSVRVPLSTVTGEDEVDTPEDNIILLDHPTDDELVQQFIRSGHQMRPHMSGVGDIFTVHAPERILRQGVKLVDSLRCWDVSASWLKLLYELAECCRSERMMASAPG